MLNTLNTDYMTHRCAMQNNNTHRYAMQNNNKKNVIHSTESKDSKFLDAK